MKYICCQPDELYYAWQIEVMLDNFISVGINPDDIHILVGFNLRIGEWWGKLREKYIDVGFFFYQNDRQGSQYPPSIGPSLMACHYSTYRNLYDEPVFYHDSDILFTKTPDFSKFLNDDIWYLSDTESYIGAEYIISKGGEQLLSRMIQYVGIGRNQVIRNQNNSGGAQHLIKNIKYTGKRSYWTDVYFASEQIYHFLKDYITEIGSSADIQLWTAGMWALLWVAWKHGNETRIDPYLNFSMATDTWPKWDKNLIYHNAGAVPEHRGKLFLKSDYRSDLPFADSNPYDPQFCSYEYYNRIIETGMNSCLKPIQVNTQELVDQYKSIFINK